MSVFKLAYKLLKNNLKMYSVYVLVLSVTAATYYNFTAIEYNKAFVHLKERIQAASIASSLSGFVLICTVIFFMWHANSFFLKQRQKETGLYMLMGISASKIGRVFAVESMLIGIFSITGGLCIGILFSKLFFMFLGYVIQLEEAIPFRISLEAMINLFVLFGVIFVILGIKNYRVIKKVQLIDMLDATKKKSSPPTYHYTKGIIGVFLIVFGYTLALCFKKWGLDFSFATLIILISVSVGTYMFFGSSFTIILGKIMHAKKFVYRNSRLIGISNVFFRQKVNYRSLAMTAVLAAATVTACSISIAFKQFEVNHRTTEAPYTFSFESDDANVRKAVEERIQQSKHNVIGINESIFYIDKVKYNDVDKKVDIRNEAIVTSYSQMEKTLSFINYDNKSSILRAIKPKRNEITFISSANSIASPVYVQGENVRISGQAFRISAYTQLPFTGNVAKYGNKNIYILHDRDYEKVRENKREIVLHGVRMTKEKESEEIINAVKGIVPGGEQAVNGVHQKFVAEYYFLGPFFFLGLIVSIVFMLATFSTIYFKILGDAFSDKEQYIMLKKIGVSKKEVQRSIYLQIGIAFVFPVIVGTIHSVIAMNMFEQMMNVTFTVPLLIGIGLFGLTMSLFYIVICKNYTKMVYED